MIGHPADGPANGSHVSDLKELPQFWLCLLYERPPIEPSSQPDLTLSPLGVGLAWQARSAPQLNLQPPTFFVQLIFPNLFLQKYSCQNMVVIKVEVN